MISTHVLDVALGRPARGIALSFEVLTANGAWDTVTSTTTNDDGRAALGNAEDFAGKTCRIRFETRAYLEAQAQPVFFPSVEITFVLGTPAERYHVPLLLSPFSYSTYRGS
jgi:5-hydroxyisourate hydrolase